MPKPNQLQPPMNPMPSRVPITNNALQPLSGALLIHSPNDKNEKMILYNFK
jgi:hypothetical protein